EQIQIAGDPDSASDDAARPDDEVAIDVKEPGQVTLHQQSALESELSAELAARCHPVDHIHGHRIEGKGVLWGLQSHDFNVQKPPETSSDNKPIQASHSACRSIHKRPLPGRRRERPGLSVVWSSTSQSCQVSLSWWVPVVRWTSRPAAASSFGPRRRPSTTENGAPTMV